MDLDEAERNFETFCLGRAETSKEEQRANDKEVEKFYEVNFDEEDDGCTQELPYNLADTDSNADRKESSNPDEEEEVLDIREGSSCDEALPKPAKKSKVQFWTVNCTKTNQRKKKKEPVAEEQTQKHANYQSLWRNKKAIMRSQKKMHAKFGFESVSLFYNREADKVFFITSEGKTITLGSSKPNQIRSKTIHEMECEETESVEKKLVFDLHSPEKLKHITDMILAHKEDSEALVWSNAFDEILSSKQTKPLRKRKSKTKKTESNGKRARKE